METICIKCTMDPTSHSFKKISEKNGVYIYYTNPTKSKLYTDGILSHYDNALKQIRDKKWVWIFDSEGFDLKHALEVKTRTGIAKLLTDKYAVLAMAHLRNRTRPVTATKKPSVNISNPLNYTNSSHVVFAPVPTRRST